MKKYFYVAIEFWPRPNLPRQYIFISRQTLAKTKRVSHYDKVYCVTTGVAKTNEPCVATKQFVS